MNKFSVLRKIREEQRETVSSMAEKLGIVVSRYQYMETGERPIPSVFADKICDILKIKPKEREQIFLPTVFTVCESKPDEVSK